MMKNRYCRLHMSPATLGSAALAVVMTAVLSLDCTYSLRREYQLPGGAASVDVAGWTVAPRIVSPVVYTVMDEPTELPTEFAISFRTSLARPVKTDPDSLTAITDLRIDSARALFARSQARLDWHFNEAAWVSYAAISPDSLVKSFRVMREFGELDWITLPADGDTIEITLFATTHQGLLLALRRSSNSPVALDTAVWRPREIPAEQLPPITLKLVRRDILAAMPGFRAGR